MQKRRQVGAFTLIELMMVVSIIGLLAAIAIPGFMRVQLRSKTAEAKTNLNAIRTAEESYGAEHGRYLAAQTSPAVYGGTTARVFVDEGPPGSNFDTVGWRPTGIVFFQYSVAASAAGTAYTVEAAADIDGNGTPQLWGYVRTNVLGASVAGVLGCPGVWDVNTGTPSLISTVGPCGPIFGQSEF